MNIKEQAAHFHKVFTAVNASFEDASEVVPFAADEETIEYYAEQISNFEDLDFEVCVEIATEMMKLS